MARLRKKPESDDEFPDWRALLGQNSPSAKQSEHQRSAEAVDSVPYPELPEIVESVTTTALEDVYTIREPRRSVGKLKVEDTVNAESLPVPLSSLSINISGDKNHYQNGQKGLEKSKSKGRRRLVRGTRKQECVKDLEPDTSEEENIDFEYIYEDLSDFVVDDSASEEELRRPPRSLRKAWLPSSRGREPDIVRMKGSLDRAEDTSPASISGDDDLQPSSKRQPKPANSEVEDGLLLSLDRLHLDTQTSERGFHDTKQTQHIKEDQLDESPSSKLR